MCESEVRVKGSGGQQDHDQGEAGTEEDEAQDLAVWRSEVRVTGAKGRGLEDHEGEGKWELEIRE